MQGACAFKSIETNDALAAFKNIRTPLQLLAPFIDSYFNLIVILPYFHQVTQASGMYSLHSARTGLLGLFHWEAG